MIVGDGTFASVTETTAFLRRCALMSTLANFAIATIAGLLTSNKVHVQTLSLFFARLQCLPRLWTHSKVV